MLNRISKTLTSKEKSEYFEHLNALNSICDFFVTLTPAEKKKLRKKGAVRPNYIQNVYASIKEFTDIPPPVFNVDEYRKDVKLHGDLIEMYSHMKSLYERFESTMLQLGNEAMRQSDEVYSYLKHAAKKSAGQQLDSSVKKIAELLKQEIKESKSEAR
ncbi:MAG: hypothetical protein EHM20_10255 [Alphaproteobacteria bacterium]|nr:MAG: hypothetical protein EHM20_10255 [Alphaproteobacteria bacterium]